jgi:hypothetical protein
MGRAARAWAEQHATLSQTVRAYEALYARRARLAVGGSPT